MNEDVGFMLNHFCLTYCFGLWLSIIMYSARYLAIPHYLFSLHRSRPVQRDFNRLRHAVVCVFPAFSSGALLFWLSLLYFGARVNDRSFRKRGHQGCLRIILTLVFCNFKNIDDELNWLAYLPRQPLQHS